MKFFRYVWALVVVSLLWCDMPLAEAQSRNRNSGAKWQQKRQVRSKSGQVNRRRSAQRRKQKALSRRNAVTRPVSNSAVRKVAVASAPSQPIGVQLIIPDIYVDAPVMRGLDDIALQDGPGHDTYSDLPGKPGNCVIAAHRNVWGAWFWHLPNLKKGALIELQTAERSYQYRVVRTLTVPDSDTSVLETPQDPKLSRLTLYTCTKPRTVSRFVVIADLVSSAPVDKQLVARPIWLQQPLANSITQDYKIVAKGTRSTAAAINQP